MSEWFMDWDGNEIPYDALMERCRKLDSENNTLQRKLEIAKEALVFISQYSGVYDETFTKKAIDTLKRMEAE